MKPHKLLLLSAMLPVLSLMGCQVGREIHYFKQGQNYYRITIHENSIASKSRYLSGFYDETALNKYFGEMSQPIEKIDSSQNVSFLNSQNGEGLQIDSNKKFVMILSTNSNVVSEQIGAFAENEQVLESIARLSNKNKIEESNKFAADITTIYSRNKAVANLGDQFINTLPNAADTTKVKMNLAVFLQYLKDQGTANTATAEILIKRFQK
ncbi:hypothetical protein [Mucilaginibacter celer]|uniref:Lipoprotein n=1 Tax=Mucilaginibacter celer TaxID=2305508 RepID=A0A494VYI7_9SPHI|nr:hypothetical protein [Mucilaginibacter celer]AYL96573.1 hypothetical protein HYN43_015260 [Mucilaginibacter celer]